MIHCFFNRGSNGKAKCFSEFKTEELVCSDSDLRGDLGHEKLLAIFLISELQRNVSFDHIEYQFLNFR